MGEYPEEIYITKEDEGTEDEFLLAHENLKSAADLEDTREVAIYKFVGVSKIITTVELEG